MNSKLLYNQKFYVLIASNKYVQNYWKKKTKTSNNECPIKFVSDLRQVNGFLRVLHFPTPIKLTATL